MNTNGKFYKRALMLLARLTFCVVVACTNPVQQEEQVTGNNDYGKEPEKKYALVIGNNDYTPDFSLSPLLNAVNDAESMWCALKILGWEVVIIRNGDLPKMKNALSDLTKKLSKNRDSYRFFSTQGTLVMMLLLMGQMGRHSP